MLKDEDLTEMVQTFVALRSSLRHMKWELATSPSEANPATSVSCSGAETGAHMPLGPCRGLTELWIPLARPYSPLSSLTSTFSTLQSVKLIPQDTPSRAEGLQGTVLCQWTPKVWHLSGSIGRIFKDQPAKVLNDCVWYMLWLHFTFLLILLCFFLSHCLFTSVFSIFHFPLVQTNKE